MERQSAGSRKETARSDQVNVTLGTLGLVLTLIGFALALALALVGHVHAAPACTRTITANVVALDQPLMLNRLGAQNVNGMIYALRRDIVERSSGKPESLGGVLSPGNVELRGDKRPRPLVLRVAAGDCLTVTLHNLLSPISNPNHSPVAAMQADEQTADRNVGFHVKGMQLVGSITDDGSSVGRNPASFVAPGQARSYRLFAEKEGTFLLTNPASVVGSEANQGNSANGLFGAVNVQPKGAKFYRSQVTEEELRLATKATLPGGLPHVNYEAKYPKVQPWIAEGKAGLPVLNVLTAKNEIIHGDLNAIVAGPNADGSFPASTYPLESRGKRNPTLPNRLEAFREFTVIFHDEVGAAQAFPGYYENDAAMRYTLAGVKDGFGINYGVNGAGSQVIANRLGVGPQHDCLSCAYEEFFLTAHVVGDPAVLVDVPANTGIENLLPGQPAPPGTAGPKASRAYFPDDPSNVHHSYLNDFVKFRNLHVGYEQHVFHLHNHQWLFNPNDDNANYIDAQGIGPGAGYTYEINFGGSGNRNKSAGDAIFHCHFYPHFAQGMWELWRIHDTFEPGTRLQVSGKAGAFHKAPFALRDGTPAANARALPDGEIFVGTPIPALVPLPGKGLAPMPAEVRVQPKVVNGITVGSVARVVDRTRNPGFPFWIAGIESTVGQRPPTPPQDMAKDAGGWDGGLPRHALEGFRAGGEARSTVSRLDVSKTIEKARPVYFPEGGTDIERVAMNFHQNQRFHTTYALPLTGTKAPAASKFIVNGGGKPGQPGAPFHEPCVDDAGKRLGTGVIGQFFSGETLTGMNTRGSSPFNADAPRLYKGANIQFDAVFNKAGYHYPQQRIIALWEDAVPTIEKQKAPEPLVMRINTFDCTMYQHTNLVPEVFELDDFQVRTPTDIIGQHIHLPKWDLTTGDGSANGWNYEDGTLSPGAVRERIKAINLYNAEHTPVTTLDGRTRLEALAHPFFGKFGRDEWLGARTTLQRWFADPVVNTEGVDRGLGIVFTHDHFGPSTHQQTGLYATVLVQPAGSRWFHNESGEEMYTRQDGGPTSWQAMIVPPASSTVGTVAAHREFYLEFSDFQHAYEKDVYVGVDETGRRVAAPTADTFRYAINPPHRLRADEVYPEVHRDAAICPGGLPRPCPQAISVDDPGTFVVNYRNEPVGLRVYDPKRPGPDGKPGMQAKGLGGDLSFALQTRTDRALPQFNTALGDTPYKPLTGDVDPGDPFTPMLRAYSGDIVKVKIQAGGHEEEHGASIHGLKWLQGGSGFGRAPNSGWKNAQSAGISEQFTLSTPVVADFSQRGDIADYAWAVNSSYDGWWNGSWGVLRNYNKLRSDLKPLPGNAKPVRAANAKDFNGVCPKTAAVRRYDITAALANDILKNPLGLTIIPADPSATMHVGGKLKADGGTLVYNSRDTITRPFQFVPDDPGEAVLTLGGKQGALHDPTAILYVRTADLDAAGQLKAGVPVEPLVVRAAAGECIEVTLRNSLPKMMPDLASLQVLPGTVKRDRDGREGSTTFNYNLMKPSSHVGLHPQLVEYDVTRSDGANVGQNPVQTVAPGGSKTYQWYAGDLGLQATNGKARRLGGTREGSVLATSAGDALSDRVNVIATPIEFGGFNLQPADRIKQASKGLYGAAVVLPQGATWTEDVNRRASATVKAGSLTYRDFAVVMAKGVTQRYRDGSPLEAFGEGGVPEDSQETPGIAMNYAVEPLWFRFGLSPAAPSGRAEGDGFGDLWNASQAFSNTLTGGADPQTPIFTAKAGQQFRMHLTMPVGHNRGSTMHLHGHLWARDPYLAQNVDAAGFPLANAGVGSVKIGANPMSFYQGAQDNVSPGSHWTIVAPAGGAFGVTGDYLLGDFAASNRAGGLWGLLRVEP